MSKHNVKLATITSVTQRVGADNIVLARVGGTNVVMRKEDAQIGSRVILVYPGAYVDSSQAPWEFMNKFGNKKRFIRIKPRKIRGFLSEAVALPCWYFSCLLPFQPTKRLTSEECYQSLRKLPSYLTKHNLGIYSVPPNVSGQTFKTQTINSSDIFCDNPDDTIQELEKLYVTKEEIKHIQEEDFPVELTVHECPNCKSFLELDRYAYGQPQYVVRCANPNCFSFPAANTIKEAIEVAEKFAATVRIMQLTELP